MKQTENGTLLLTDRWADYRWFDSLFADAAELAEELGRSRYCIGLDVETKTAKKDAKAPDARRDDLVGAGFSFDFDCAFFLPVYGLATDGFVDVLKRQLPGKAWYAFNAMFDATVLRRYGVRLGEHAGDARIIAYLLGEPDAALKPLLQRWLAYPTLEYHEVLEQWGASDISQVPVEVQADYCALQDAAQCIKLERRMRQELPERSLGVYTGIELPMVNVLVDMSDEGIRFDRELGQQMHDSDRQKRERYDELIATLIAATGFEQWEQRAGELWLPTCKSCRNGKKKRESCESCKGRGKLDPVEMAFNPGSGKQVREWLYGHMSAPVRRYTGGRTAWQVKQDIAAGLSVDPATDKLALLQLKDFHEIVPMLLTRAKLAKREGFERKWLELSEADGRLHTTFTNTTVVSGRLSSRNPNLQQCELSLRVLFTGEP